MKCYLPFLCCFKRLVLIFCLQDLYFLLSYLNLLNANMIMFFLLIFVGFGLFLLVANICWLLY